MTGGAHLFGCLNGNESKEPVSLMHPTLPGHSVDISRDWVFVFFRALGMEKTYRFLILMRAFQGMIKVVSSLDKDSRQLVNGTCGMRALDVQLLSAA